MDEVIVRTKSRRWRDASRAVTSEGATQVLLDDGEGYAAVRYTLAPGRDGFLAVKRVGGVRG